MEQTKTETIEVNGTKYYKCYNLPPFEHQFVLVDEQYMEFDPNGQSCERDPMGRSSKEKGSKLDAGKPSVYRGLLDYFPRACIAVATVSAVGANKYSWKGWESVPDGVNRYSDAMVRHILSESIEGPVDKDTQLLHKAQVAWNALAALELYLREQDGRT